LATKGPFVARLKSRGVIRFDGPDVVHYLQGLLTNDVTRFESKTHQESATPSPNTSAAFYPPVYSAVLSPQGRVLFDLFLYKPSSPIEKLNRSGSGPGDGNDNTPALLADVDAAALDDLLAFLKKYVSLSLSLLYFRVFCTFSPSDPWAFMLNMLLNFFPISSWRTLRK
jgi:folate-binding Fe-S cluster repair protein YgfZ